ncbi:MAG TPA: hypothetical protein EYO58_08035 [Flavobacteriales bacterium]|nr:hypothetical protein [Flavobacteriales bacterium]
MATVSVATIIYYSVISNTFDAKRYATDKTHVVATLSCKGESEIQSIAHKTLSIRCDSNASACYDKLRIELDMKYNYHMEACLPAFGKDWAFNGITTLETSTSDAPTSLINEKSDFSLWCRGRAGTDGYGYICTSDHIKFRASHPETYETIEKECALLASKTAYYELDAYTNSQGLFFDRCLQKFN